MGFVLELSLIFLNFATQLNRTSTLLEPLFALPYSIYLLAVVWVTRSGRRERYTSAVIVITAFAFVMNATFLLQAPSLSFDIYRYMWDGKVAANGINPYLYWPNATELVRLRDANWELVNHKELRTGYPPLMEMLFEALYLAFRSILSYKITFFLFDLATIGTICLILRELKLELKNALIYAWAPLPIVEITQSGHNDSAAIFLVLVSFLLLLRNRNNSSAIVMALAVLTKLYPLFFAPVLFKRWGKWGTASFLALLFALHIPYANIGGKIYLGLLYAINTSYFNGSAFPFLTNLVSWTKLTSNPGFGAQVMTYFIYASLLLWALWKSFRRSTTSIELMKTAFLLTGAVLLLDRSPFAWYLTWIIPFLCFFSSSSWMLLTGTTFLGYMKYNTLPPPPFEGVSPLTAFGIDLIQYVPFYVILAYELFNHKIRLRPQTVLASSPNTR